MRNWFYILLAILPVLSCVGQKDDPTPELRLVADLTAINVTAGEYATFTVFSGAEDVTAYASIRNVTDGKDLESNVFSPVEEGEWTFVATLDGAESEPVTVTAIVISDEGKDFFRRSLVLDFTGTWCVNCPKMEAALEEAMAARPGKVFWSPKDEISVIRGTATTGHKKFVSDNTAPAAPPPASGRRASWMGRTIP